MNELAKSIVGFDSWKHADKIRFFAWFLHSQKEQDRISSATIKDCYELLHLEAPNISQFLSDMEKRSPKQAIRDSRGYYLTGQVRNRLEQRYGEKTLESKPKSEQVLSMSVVMNTRGYYARIIEQANGCYERHWFDACSVMIRKFVEILIIEVYEANHKADLIKDRNGDFLMLRDLITIMIADPMWNLGRETKKSLPEIKTMGDRSAHMRRYLATKPDVDKVIPGLRIIADELLHLAKLKQ